MVMSKGNINVGNKVWWEDDGYILTGKVTSLPSFNTDWKAVVLTDCGKVRTSVWLESLHKGKCPFLKY
jgi:hypothetical protein